MERYANLFALHRIEVGQVLLTRDVLGNRNQYLNARAAMLRMLELGVLPIVNENDTVAVDEVRLGDNDRLAAIASHLVRASMLVILTDTDGLYTTDPNIDASAELLGAVAHTDAVLDQLRHVHGAGALGSGGVATKVVAARMAGFSGIPTVIAPTSSSSAVANAVAGEEIGTWIDASDRPIGSKKLWIAFGLPSSGSVQIDDGALSALRYRGTSLLRVGVTGATGEFERGDAIEIETDGNGLVAKGVTRWSSADLRTGTDAAAGPVVHRDDLVLLI
jgi:glutamate 5-kinase